MFSFNQLRNKLNNGAVNSDDFQIEACRKRLTFLDPAEYKVFMLLREGFLKKECALRLNMKRGELKSHIKSIFKKLNVRNTTELIVNYCKVSQN